jgi:signal transduction histidine kinase
MDPATPSVAWIAIVSSVITIAVVGLAAAMLVVYQRRMASEAKRWGRQVLAAQDAERRRVGMELHDDLGQRLHATMLAVERGESATVSSALGEITARLRSLARELHPPVLAGREFTLALAGLVQVHDRGGAPALHLTAPEIVSLPDDVALALYRVAQEGLINALKHAEADTIRITLEEEANAVTLIIADDGVGIPDPSKVRGSFGLRSMQERMTVVGGTLEIGASTPHGTRLVARVPRA